MKRKRRHLRSHGKALLSSAPMRSEINVTPLVDVVLVLLIIFMVVTPELSRGVKVDLPETVNHQKREDSGREVVVSVADNGQAFVGDEAASGDMLVFALKKAMGKNDDHSVHVKADHRLTFGQVREVLERVHEAGAARVALGTEEKKRPAPTGAP